MGVDVFFVLSGFVLSLVYLPNLTERFNWTWYRKFLSRRFAKIYPMHLLTFAATGLLILAGKLYGYRFIAPNVENTTWTAACNLLMIHAFGLTSNPSWNGNSWSISAEWFAYTLLFAPICFLFRRTRVVWIVLITALLWSLLVIACGRFFPEGIGQITTDGALRILPEFIAGYLLYRLIHDQSSKWGDMFTAAGLALLVAVSILHYRLTFLLLPAIMVLLTGLYFGGRFTRHIFGNWLMVKVGEASYSIYLVQGLVRSLTRFIFGRFGMDFGHSPVPSAAGCACAVLTGILAFHVFEEPSRLWLLRMFGARMGQRTSSSPGSIHA